MYTGTQNNITSGDCYTNIVAGYNSLPALNMKCNSGKREGKKISNLKKHNLGNPIGVKRSLGNPIVVPQEPLLQRVTDKISTIPLGDGEEDNQKQFTSRPLASKDAINIK